MDLGVEIKLKEKHLYTRAMKNFNKIRGHSKEQVIPDMYLDPEKMKDNIRKKIIDPCKKIT